MATFEGKVVKGSFGKGSKSEYEAVYLVTPTRRYVLRRQGGNPFHDEELLRIVGKRIRCSGTPSDYLLKVSKWTVLDDD